MSKNNLEGFSSRERAELAARVKDVRLRVGMTQQELAEAAGVTRQSVGNIESGTMTPQVKTLIPVLEALGIKPKAAEFSAETSRWLAIVGGIMDSLPDDRKANAGQAAVTAVTNELVEAAHVGGATQTDGSTSQSDFQLAARKRSANRGEID